MFPSCTKKLLRMLLISTVVVLVLIAHLCAAKFTPKEDFSFSSSSSSNDEADTQNVTEEVHHFRSQSVFQHRLPYFQHKRTNVQREEGCQNDKCAIEMLRQVCSTLKPSPLKRNTELINSILGLPRVLQDAGK